MCSSAHSCGCIADGGDAMAASSVLYGVLYLTELQYFFTDEMQARYTGVKAAIEKAHDADRLESMQDYNQALECYKDAVGILIPLIEGSYTYEYIHTSCFVIIIRS